jgi:hypothetical protein
MAWFQTDRFDSTTGQLICHIWINGPAKSKDMTLEDNYSCAVSPCSSSSSSSPPLSSFHSSFLVVIGLPVLPLPATNINNFVGFEVLIALVMKSTIFWDITLCSPLNLNQRFEGIYCLHLHGRRISRARNLSLLCLPLAFTLVTCSIYSSTLKMEAIYFSETSVDIQRTTRRYIPEDGTLHK